MNLRDAEIGLRSQQEKYKSALNKLNQVVAPCRAKIMINIEVGSRIKVNVFWNYQECED